MKNLTLPVFYDARMGAESGGYSPSASKPRKVVEHWLGGTRRGIAVDVLPFEPATEADLARAHDPAYVRGVLSGEVANGFGNRRGDVARSLPWTSGALLAAAQYALDHRTAPAACAPVSGFHHASYAAGGGFCTFNGLLVAALALLVRDVQVRRVGVLDCDMHYGDGTDDVLRRGVPGSHRVLHYSAGARYTRREHAQSFLSEELPRVVRWFGAKCDVVLYQAGADPHVDDPLGGWLTTAQLAERDRLVFAGLRRAGVPVAWCFAGGYQRAPDGSIPAVIKIHTNTAREALRAARIVERPACEGAGC